MVKDSKFYNFDEEARENALNYFINVVISARIETGLRSNSFCLDEDVNICLAHLLANYACSEYVSSISKHICLYESDIVQRQENSIDIRERFLLYKHSADYILFTLGVFHGFNRKLPEYQGLLRLNNDVYIARARSYYCQAAEYFRKLKRKRNGVSEVLDKLSENFTAYLNILYHVRDKYFKYVEKFSDGEWFHFVHKNIIFRKGVDSKVYVELMDAFLSHLSAYKKSFRQEDRDMLRIIGAELKRLNPEFNYDIEKLVAVRAA